MKLYDEVLGKEENIHETVKPESEKEIVMKDPDTFGEIWSQEVSEDE